MNFFFIWWTFNIGITIIFLSHIKQYREVLITIFYKESRKQFYSKQFLKNIHRKMIWRERNQNDNNGYCPMVVLRLYFFFLLSCIFKFFYDEQQWKFMKRRLSIWVNYPACCRRSYHTSSCPSWLSPVSSCLTSWWILIRL